MEHYYSSNPTSNSDEKMIEYEMKGRKLEFITDNGVFSKTHVDFATSFLLHTIFEEVKGNVLDLGCGYGVIGIAVAQNPAVSKVTMCDINVRALNLAKRNAIHNQVQDFEVIETDGFAKIEGCFDTIITNPPIRAGKAVIYQMYEDSKAHLKEGGTFYLVINKKHGAPSTLAYLKKLFSNVEILDKKAGFHVIRCFA